MKDYSANYDTPQQDLTIRDEFSQCLSDKVPFRWEVQDGAYVEGYWEQAPTNGPIFSVVFSREDDVFSRTAGIYTANQGEWWPGSFEHIPKIVTDPLWDEIWDKLHDDNNLTTSAAVLEEIRRGKIILAIPARSSG